MKELSMEQKTKAYDEALERVKKLLSRCRNNRDRITMVYRVNDIESIFPELKESEDEKIRKGLINGFNECLKNSQYSNNAQKYWHNIKIEDIFAWLEKQSEQEKPQVYKTKDGETITYSETEGYNIVEPKFHEGEWVVYDGWTTRILKVTYDGYVNNKQGFIPKEREDCMRLWDITKDAKDGDVLAISWWEDNNFWEKIIIFKKYHNKGVKGLYCMPCVEGYGNTFKNRKLAFNEKVPYYSKIWTCNLHPATKEQRDTLEKAMTDAGYTFNFEKKELKKIEESENIKNQIMSEITDLVKDYITQKSAKCSEEDELSCFENALFTAFSDAWQQYLRGKEVDIAQWAKEHSKELLEAAKEELKGHNSAWSEEDTEISSMLIELIESKEKSIEAKVEFVAWLKSLKKRMNNV